LIQILGEVGSGLEALHSANIIHRDVKLENVFMFKNGHCKIGDFSLSKELEHSLKSASSVVGTRFTWNHPISVSYLFIYLFIYLFLFVYFFFPEDILPQKS
jgi:serine/threonine protein kinase